MLFFSSCFFVYRSFHEKVVIEEGEDVLAECVEFFFDLFLLSLDKFEVFLLPFLEACSHAPRRSACTYGVLVRDGEQVSLFDREFLVELYDFLHVFHHVFESLERFGHPSKLHAFLTWKTHWLFVVQRWWVKGRRRRGRQIKKIMEGIINSFFYFSVFFPYVDCFCFFIYLFNLSRNPMK